MSSSGPCGRNLSHGLFRCSNKDCQAVQVYLLELLSLFRAREKNFFRRKYIPVSQCFYVAQFTCHMTSRGVLFTLVVRITMSTSMFLLLLVNVLCFAQNLRCMTTVSCDSKVKRS